jgi:hypothetical protein
MSRKTEIEAALTRLIQRIEGASITASAYVSGKTTKGLEPRSVTEMGGQLWGYVYTGTLDKGRKPGKFPPIAGIRQWVIMRGIDKAWQMSSHSAAYLIARKISREGTNLYKHGGRTTILQDNYELFEQEIMEMLGRETMQTINKTFEK